MRASGPVLTGAARADTASAEPSSSSRSASATLGTIAALLVVYAGTCKALLFRDLEYSASDMYSFLDMSRSWFHNGRLLWDNVYGDHTAIHNFYMLLAFSPLTIPLGAYGLIAGLVLLNVLAVLRTASCDALDLAGKVATVGAVVSPIALAVFDHPGWGFHPELCYPALALLLACDLLERQSRRAIALALLIVLVKEDGAVLCACVLFAFFAQRFWTVPRELRKERREIARNAALSLVVMVTIFAGGMALLYVRSRRLAPGGATAPIPGFGSLDVTASTRLTDSWRVLASTLSGHEHGGRVQLTDGLLGYAAVGAAMLLPLGRRSLRGVALLALASPPLLIVLAVSSASYGFGMMLWPPRVSTVLALVITCLAFAASTPAPARSFVRGRAVVFSVTALMATSWGLQLLLLREVRYSPWPRLRAPALLSARGYRASTFPAQGLRFLRCLGADLPLGLPVASPSYTNPVFHLQSVVFEVLEGHPSQPPRLRVIQSSDVAPTRAGALCRDPGVGGFAVEADCALLPVVSRCRERVERAPP